MVYKISDGWGFWCRYKFWYKNKLNNFYFKRFNVDYEINYNWIYMFMLFFIVIMFCVSFMCVWVEIWKEVVYLNIKL